MPHVLDVDFLSVGEARLLPKLGVLVREVLRPRGQLVDLIHQPPDATLLLVQGILERMDLIHSLFKRRIRERSLL